MNELIKHALEAFHGLPEDKQIDIAHHMLDVAEGPVILLPEEEAVVEVG